MRASALLLLAAVLAFPLQGLSQSATAPAAKPKPAQVQRPAVPKHPAPGSPRAVYDAMAEAERIAIQADLIWTGDYNGMANGAFDDPSIAAVKAYQKRNAGKETGILNPDERGKLAHSAKVHQDRVGWRVVDDKATGARLGVPMKLVPQSAAAPSGSRWQSGRGEVQVETFRVAGTTLAQAFEQQKKNPPQRRPDYNVLRGDFFVISGLQGLKKFYVRAHVKDEEVRGVTVLYDQAMEGIMEPVAVAMSNTFAAFPVGGPPPRRKVEYATGIVVSAAGHILTDRQAVDDCRAVVVAGRFHADKLADDKASLALLRVYGARGLAGVPLARAGTEGAREVTLAGIADPQAQGGGGNVSTAAARLGPGGITLAPAPAPGFSGAAAIDGEARLVGMVVGRAHVVAGPAQAGATLVPAEQIGKFLAAENVPAASGASSLDVVKAATVRVICVRE